MENIFPSSDQPQVLRKRSDLPQDDSFEKEVSTDNSYLSLDRANSTPIHSAFDTLALNAPQDTAASTSPNPVASTASQSTVKCQYCDKSCAKEDLFKHQDDCEMRKINCEACGEVINIDIFDFHLETCSHRAGYGIYQNYQNYEEYQNGGFGYTMNYGNPEQQPQSGEAGSNEENANQAEQGEQPENFQEPEHEDEEEEEGEDEYGFDPDTLTYEQLIYLDNFIEKKGMTAEEIAKFPVEEHCKEVHGISSCSVCISEFENGEIRRQLPCGHKFHKDCIDTWMDLNITCPICKKFLR